MAVNVHDVTPGDVVDRLPMASGTVTSDSAGLTTGMIENWIRSAAGILNAVLRSRGIDPDNLEDEERELMREGIIAYAESKALAARDYDDEKVGRAYEHWKDTREIIREFPTDFDSDDASNRVKSNESTTKPRWSADKFGGW